MAPRVVALISCSKSKGKRRAPAGELYAADPKSYVFKKSVEFVTRVLGIKDWRILSAKHHLLDPGKVIAPYDLTLSKMTPDARRRWVAKTRKQIEKEFPKGTHFIVLAGASYLGDHEELIPPGYSYDTPLRGLGTGLRRRWLKEATA